MYNLVALLILVSSATAHAAIGCLGKCEDGGAAEYQPPAEPETPCGEANSLLKNHVSDSKKFVLNTHQASEIAKSAEDARAADILHKFAELESIARGLRGSPECTVAELDKLDTVKKLIIQHCDPGYEFSGDAKDRRVSKIVLELSKVYLNFCTQQINRGIRSYYQNSQTIHALNLLKAFDCFYPKKDFRDHGLETGFPLVYKESAPNFDHATWLCLANQVPNNVNRKKREHTVKATALFPGLFESSCGLIDGKATLRERFELGLKFAEIIDSTKDHTNEVYELDDLLAYYKVCKLAQNLDIAP